MQYCFWFTALMDRDIFRGFCLVSSATIGLIPRMRAPVLKIIQPLTIPIIIVRKWPQVCRWKKQDHLELGIGQNSIYCQAPEAPTLKRGPWWHSGSAGVNVNLDPIVPTLSGSSPFPSDYLPRKWPSRGCYWYELSCVHPQRRQVEVSTPIRVDVTLFGNMIFCRFNHSGMSSVHEGGPQSDLTGAIIKRDSLTTEKDLPRGKRV